MELTHHIEAILFATAEPMSLKELSTITGEEKEEVRKAVEALAVMTRDRGVVLVRSGEMVELRTHQDASSVVEKALEEPFSRTIGPAGVEVLSIILYNGPATRGDIEHIRGVNSGSALRLLSLRGLIQRRGEGESRLYEATTDTLAHFGVTSIEELPDYEETKHRLTTLAETLHE